MPEKARGEEVILVVLLVIGIIILGLAFLLARLTLKGSDWSDEQMYQSARVRYASGEIPQDEFLKIKAYYKH